METECRYLECQCPKCRITLAMIERVVPLFKKGSELMGRELVVHEKEAIYWGVIFAEIINSLGVDLSNRSKDRDFIVAMVDIFSAMRGDLFKKIEGDQVSPQFPASGPMTEEQINTMVEELGGLRACDAK